MSVEEEVSRLRDGQRMLTDALHNLSIQQAVTSANVTTTSTNVDRLSATVEHVGEHLATLVTKFALVEKLVLGTVAAVLIAALGAGLTYVIRDPSILSKP